MVTQRAKIIDLVLGHHGQRARQIGGRTALQIMFSLAYENTAFINGSILELAHVFGIRKLRYGCATSLDARFQPASAVTLSQVGRRSRPRTYCYHSAYREVMLREVAFFQSDSWSTLLLDTS